MNECNVNRSNCRHIRNCLCSNPFLDLQAPFLEVEVEVEVEVEEAATVVPEDMADYHRLRALRLRREDSDNCSASSYLNASADQ